MQCWKPRKHEEKQTTDCTRCICQHGVKCSIKWAKKMQHSFFNNSVKKSSNSTGENPEVKCACMKNCIAKKKHQTCAQKRKIRAFSTPRTNLARWQQRTVSQNNFFKIKPPGMTTNEIVLFLPPLSGYYIRLHTGRRRVVEK